MEIYEFDEITTMKFYNKDDVLSAVEELKKLIREQENHYPKDIFCWDNKEELDFNRGRFNQHCYEIVENVRKDLLNLIDEVFDIK